MRPFRRRVWQVPQICDAGAHCASRRCKCPPINPEAPRIRYESPEGIRPIAHGTRDSVALRIRADLGSDYHGSLGALGCPTHQEMRMAGDDVQPNFELYRSREEQVVRSELVELFRQCPIPDAEI